MERKLLIMAMVMMLPALAFSQCRKFTKNKCMPALGEYIPNDNFNSAILVPGDEAELMMTFYAGQDYRVMVCTQEILGDVGYTVLNQDGEQVFDSKSAPGPFLDFSVANTQQLKMVITVPESSTTTGLVHEGCATVLVGYKDKVGTAVN